MNTCQNITYNKTEYNNLSYLEQLEAYDTNIIVNGNTSNANLDFEGKKIDLDTIMYIHNLKTAALIEASMMAGAILAGATQTQIDTVENIANNVGIAFQIQDDILDIISTTEKLGKPVLSDEKNDKTTYVSLCGLEKAKDDVKKMSSSAVELLDTLDEKNEFLNNLIIKLINREK